MMARPPKIVNQFTGKIALTYKEDFFEYWEQYNSKDERRQIIINWIMKYHLYCRNDLCNFYFLIKPN
jgi:hypothetical protein